MGDLRALRLGGGVAPKLGRTHGLVVRAKGDEAVLLADEVLLLTKRPTQVAERLVFDAPRPRSADTTVTPAFVQTKTRALEIFQREVRA